MRTHWSWDWEGRSLVLRSGGTMKIDLTPNGPFGWLVNLGKGRSYKKESFAAALACALDALDLPAALRAVLEKDALARGVPGFSPGDSGASGVEYAALIGLIAALALVVAISFGGRISSSLSASASSIDAATLSAAAAADGHGAAGNEDGAAAEEENQAGAEAQPMPDAKPGKITIWTQAYLPGGGVNPDGRLALWQPYLIRASEGATIASVSISGLPSGALSAAVENFGGALFEADVWDQILEQGEAAPPGTYPITISATDTKGVSLSRVVIFFIPEGTQL